MRALTHFVASVACVSAYAVAQDVGVPTPKIWRVGFISPGGPSASGAPETFRARLAQLGFVDGRNLALDVKYARGRYDQVPLLTKELLTDHKDAIAVLGAVIVRGAKPLTGDTPLLFTVVVDPVAEDLVPDMSRPGGRITGVTNLDPQQPQKRIALLKEAVPSLRVLAVLGDAGVSDAQMKAAEAAAATSGIRVVGIRIDGKAPGLEDVFAKIALEKAEAVLILEEPVMAVHRIAIATLAKQAKLPTMFPPFASDCGGLLFYGVNLPKAVERMADMTARVLKGENPGTIAVETVVSYDLLVNSDTAASIGIEIPASILSRADRIISGPPAAK